MKKKFLTAMVLSVVFGMLVIMPVYAGWNQDDQGWTYQNEDGSSPGIGWQWIDGKCYYFGNDGHILTNTTTPDNYQVDANGAWVIDGVVQTQGGGTAQSSDDYDPQYPLRGRIEQYFSHNSEGRLIWKWDEYEIPRNYNEEVEAVGSDQYVFNCAVRDRDPEYLNNYVAVELAVLAELSGYEQMSLEPENQMKKEQMVNNIRSFLNSFDFRNASDYEKAVHIANWITKADYSANEWDNGYSYACLVTGYADCNGYTNAACLLATCVGLKSGRLGDFTHAYPVFLVEDIWLAYEPTTKDECFTIAKVYTPGHYLDGIGQLTQFGKYCEAIGYMVPEISDIKGRFPDIRIGIKNGEQAAFIFFK